VGIAALVVDERTLAGGVLDVLFGDWDPLGARRMNCELEDVERVPCIASSTARNRLEALRFPS
jgi:hypothetical protein